MCVGCFFWGEYLFAGFAEFVEYIVVFRQLSSNLEGVVVTPTVPSDIMATFGHPAARTSLLPFLLSFLVFYLISTTQAISFLGLSNTYARYPKWHACPNASLSFEFRTSQSSAMLVYTDDNGRYDYLQLALTKGSVRLLITFVAEASRYVDIEANTEPLNDGRWHRVEIRRNRAQTILLVDGSQTSKVSLGSDDDVIFRDVADRKNYVYFGGIPDNYHKRRPAQFTNERFAGSLRNILYFNCSCVPVRASMVDGYDVDEQEREACEVNNPCPAECPCVSGDDGPGCQCNYKRECFQQLTSYHLPCDRLEDGTLINYSGLQSQVEGGPQLVRGVHNNALLLNGRSQWLKVDGSSHRQECMGDLSQCKNGYYMGMWLQFRNVASGQKGVYLSNGGHTARSHGVAILYANGALQVIFRMPDGRLWSAETREVVNGRWYHVAASWDVVEGLYLYVNGELKALDTTAASDRGPGNRNPTNNAFYIGRANDNTGTNILGEVMLDEFMFVAAFKSQKEVREAGAITHYYLPMDEMQNREVSGHGLSGKAYGSPTLVDGKVRKALRLSGSRQYLDLEDVNGTCLGDPSLCRYGLYMSVWLMFNRLESGRKAVITSPGFAIYQDGAQLFAVIRDQRQHWQTTMRLRARVWYFLELSWSAADGLSLYANRVRVHHQTSYSNRLPESLDSTNMYVGKDAALGSRYPACVVDELNVYYADRNTLSNIDFIQTGRPGNLYFDMDSLSQAHGSVSAVPLGNPRLGKGKVGSAIILDGNKDALDFLDNSDRCFGNLDLCAHGVLLSLWLRPDRLRNDAYFLWTGTSGLSILYDNGKLKVEANTAGQVWDVSTSNFDANKWYFVEVSFHPHRRLELYLNGRLVAESEEGRTKKYSTPARPGEDRVYLGQAATGGLNGAGAYDELDVWYADRDYLTSQGYIQRGLPDSIIVDFEELSPDQLRVLHSTLTIRLIGNSRLVPGKIGKALELSGDGEYADLGSQSNTCMGNLARCQQGITVSAWMRFHSYENNMVFLSTGTTGLLLLFRDGYVLASADGRDQISAPKLELNRWYHVELSWHPNHGLKLFVDNQQVSGESFPFSYNEASSDISGRFYVGRPNYGDVRGGNYVTGNFDIDQLEVWYARREDLLAFGYIRRYDLGCENFPMDSSQGDRVVQPSHDLRLMNGATLGPGRQGRALQLNGRGQYLDMGYQQDNCLGNLTLCPHGFTLSVWLRPNTLSENMHFIAAPSYFLFYEDSELSAEFNSKDKSWLVSTSNFRTGEWQRVTLAWHEVKGLRMYIDDQLVDSAGGMGRSLGSDPASGRLYLGRNLVDTRMTADVEMDELQICNDDFDHLQAAGDYQVEVLPVIVSFESLRNGYIILRNRRIYAIGDVRLTEGLLPNTRAVYLNGRNQYLNFGDNFTCSGDLHTCREGVTFRMSVKPERLQDGMYLVDSLPVSLYYKDGRLHGEMRVGRDVWTVDTSDFKPGQWSRVEMTWHPSLGLALYVNGIRMSYRKYANQRNERDGDAGQNGWKTYLGRPIRLSDGSYSNIHVDSVELYNAHRDYIDNDNYLNILLRYLRDLERTTRPPVITVRPPQITTRRPVFTPAPTTRVPILPETGEGITRIVRLDGKSFARFNFNLLPPQFLTKAEEEVLTLMFLTSRPDGLLWFQEEDNRDMYLALKNGRVVFVNDEKTRAPDRVTVGERGNVRFDDYRWHKITVRRSGPTGRRIVLTVDDQHEEEYIFPDDIQFLSPAQVWLGGSRDTARKTAGFVSNNFNGGVADVIYVSNRREGQRIIQNEVNLVSLLARGNLTGNVTIEKIGEPIQPTPPPTRTTPPTQPPLVKRTTSISVVDQGVGFQVQALTLRSGSSITFSFKTLNQDGLLLFSGSPQDVYFAIELVDGRLYFVHNFGRQSYRTPFSKKILADGQTHEVEVRFYPNAPGHVDLRMDNIRERLELRNGERMPSALGTLYVIGMPEDKYPWNVWSRQGYIGCFIDLRVDSRVIDFESLLGRVIGKVLRGCIAVSQDCTMSRPCVHGQCRNTMVGHICDCSMTPYRGPECGLDAWTALFNGSITGRLDFASVLRTHQNDISLRFRTPARDGLLFESRVSNMNDFLRASMDNGQVKVETNLGGEIKTVKTGNNLNDLQYHTLYIQRRGNEMEVWVDDSPHEKAMLAGQGFYLNTDRIHVGGVHGSDNTYIGYLQNFYLDGQDVLAGLRGTAATVDRQPALPPLIYHAVTFPDLDSYVSLQSLNNPQASVLQFMFKTKEPSGVLLFTSGRNQGYLVVELFEGNLYIQFSAGGSQPLHVMSHQKVNDDQWHAVTIRRTGSQNQFQLTVDGVTSSVSYAGRDALVLDGPVYIGGVPKELFQRDDIKNGVFSRTGFRGCLASMDLGGKVINLREVANVQKVNIYDSCRPIISRPCTADFCKNFGTCIDVGANTFRCDCDMSAHSGSVCLDQPVGYRFQNFTKSGKKEPGSLIYSFPLQTTIGSSRDEIAFGVMTKQKDAILLRVFSEIFKDYIEFRLNDGSVEVHYDTDGEGGKNIITQWAQTVNDGKYHIVRFIRTANNATLHVDQTSVNNVHSNPQGNFDRMSKIYIGGGYDPRLGKILEGFDGIVGGLHINGLLVFTGADARINTRYIGDVVLAPRPFNLTSGSGGVVVLPPGTTTTIRPPTTTPKSIATTVPGSIGGGGIGWTPGGNGVDTHVYPGGDRGTGVLVPGGSGGSGISPALAGFMGGAPPLSGPGPRAGAVVGTVLGLLALASALMWAFVSCKPGWCWCLKPPVADAMVSAPLLSGSNKGAVIAAGGGVSGAGGTITGLGEGAGLNGAGAGGGNVFNNYYLSSSGTAGGGGGTAIGTGTASSGGAYSSHFQEHGQMASIGGSVDRMDGGIGGGSIISPASLQSYHYEGAGESTTADYDFVTGIHPIPPSYHTNTMSSAHGGSVSGGFTHYQTNTMSTTRGGSTSGGFDSGTLQSHYDYTIKNLGSVSGMRQMSGYKDSNVMGIPAGVLGEEVRVDCCLMGSDGRSVVTGSSLGPPQVWNMQSGELLRIMQGEIVGSTNLHLACDDHLLVGAINADLPANQSSVPKGVNNYVLQIWDFMSGKPMAMPNREVCSAVTMLREKGNDKVVFARTDMFSAGTNVVVWDLLGNQAIKDMWYNAPVGHDNDFVRFLAVSQNNRYVIAGFTNSFDKSAEFIVFDITLASYTASNLSIMRLDADPECTAVLPNNEAVTGMRNGELVIWSMRTCEPTRQLMAESGRHAHTREVKAVTLSENSRYLVSGSADGTVKLFDMASERHMHTFNGHTDEVWCCTISSDNEIVVSGSRDMTIRLWKLKDGTAFSSFNAGVDIFYLTMSRDGSTIVGLGDKLGARKLVMLEVMRTKVRRQVED